VGFSVGDGVGCIVIEVLGMLVGESVGAYDGTAVGISESDWESETLQSRTKTL
jgi:hypothetical protein